MGTLWEHGRSHVINRTCGNLWKLVGTYGNFVGTLKIEVLDAEDLANGTR